MFTNSAPKKWVPSGTLPQVTEYEFEDTEDPPITGVIGIPAVVGGGFTSRKYKICPSPGELGSLASFSIVKLVTSILIVTALEYKVSPAEGEVMEMVGSVLAAALAAGLGAPITVGEGIVTSVGTGTRIMVGEGTKTTDGYGTGTIVGEGTGADVTVIIMGEGAGEIQDEIYSIEASMIVMVVIVLKDLILFPTSLLTFYAI